MTIGECIANKRKDCGLTQEELAQLAGTSQSYLSLVESDKCVPGINLLKRLSKALNVECSYFRS